MKTLVCILCLVHFSIAVYAEENVYLHIIEDTKTKCGFYPDISIQRTAIEHEHARSLRSLLTSARFVSIYGELSFLSRSDFIEANPKTDHFVGDDFLAPGLKIFENMERNGIVVYKRVHGIWSMFKLDHYGDLSAIHEIFLLTALPGSSPDEIEIATANAIMAADQWWIVKVADSDPPVEIVFDDQLFGKKFASTWLTYGPYKFASAPFENPQSYKAIRVKNITLIDGAYRIEVVNLHRYGSYVTDLILIDSETFNPIRITMIDILAID